ncbi:glycosyltransferase family 2 protein [Pontibacter silvestris]|uniref:Glycosyltransferase family 2 protein n=1 Tax=Pontibacter silvestris TaxID=2305183 RepID=A0ABW4WWQ4_9BACT|nr:glycosyltransferase family 2 protein [Pontibacter silvestris]MCC9138828.1 glycosyltransferase family 2 protein [Pontibacter silvestris]
MNRPLVSVISVNYNQASVTCEMIASMQKVTYPNVEIIVVDNASPTDDPGIIEESYPEVKLIRSFNNLGYAGGNNLGVEHAKGDYLLFLNNDTEVDPGFLEPLVDLFENNPKAGVASPKIIYFGTDNLIQYAGSKGINSWTGRSITIGSLEKDKGQHDQSLRTELADGAAMMVPMRIVKQVGLMPEMYFLYYEELDWCEMIKRAGFTCHYVAGSTIYHKESISVGKASVLKTYYMNRNRLLFIRRNMKGVALWTSSLVFLMAAVPKKALTFSLKSEWKHLKALVRGLWWNLTSSNIHQNKHLSAQNLNSSTNQEDLVLR